MHILFVVDIFFWGGEGFVWLVLSHHSPSLKGVGASTWMQEIALDCGETAFNSPPQPSPQKNVGWDNDFIGTVIAVKAQDLSLDL